MRVHRPTLAAAAAATLLVLAAGCGAAAAPSATTPAAAGASAPAAHCELAFRYGLGVGPDAGQKAAGTLSFDRADDGTLKGTFTPTGGAALPILGQTSGLSLSIVLPTSDNKGVVFGSGQFAEPLSAGHCGISAGGTLTGPNEGDLGDWISPGVGTGVCPPGSSHSNGGATIGIDRSGGPCIPNFYFDNL